MSVYIPRRHIVVAMCVLGAMITYFMRVNMSMVMDGEKGCADEFAWDNTDAAYVLAAFYMGYAVSQPLGGYLSTRFGALWVSVFAVFWSCSMEALSPLAMPHFPAILAVRCSMGLGEGFFYPAVYALFSRWCPPKERSTALALFWAGGNAAIAAAMGVSPPLLERYGWRLTFYASGGAGAVWCVAMAQLCSSCPLQHGNISRNEVLHITKSLSAELDSCSTPGRAVPWRKILTSPAVWVVIACNFASDWPKYLFVSFGPRYLNTVLEYGIQQSGAVGMAPYMGQTLVCIFAGWLADHLLRRGTKRRTVRVLMQSVGLVIPAACIAGISFAGTPRLAIFCYSMTIAVSGFLAAGFACNFLEIAPYYAGIVQGISNAIANTSGAIGPILTGKILDAFHCPNDPPAPDSCVSGWRIIFLSCASVYGGSAILWALFAKFEPVIVPEDDGGDGHGGATRRERLFSTSDRLSVQNDDLSESTITFEPIFNQIGLSINDSAGDVQKKAPSRASTRR